MFKICVSGNRHTPGYHFASNGKKVNHLLFMDDLKLYESNEKWFESLIPAVRVFSNYIGMKFWVERFAALTMKKRKMANSDGTALPNKTTMQWLKVSDICKYLGVIQADGVKYHEIKENAKTERRVRKSQDILI